MNSYLLIVWILLVVAWFFNHRVLLDRAKKTCNILLEAKRTDFNPEEVYNYYSPFLRGWLGLRGWLFPKQPSYFLKGENKMTPKEKRKPGKVIVSREFYWKAIGRVKLSYEKKNGDNLLVLTSDKGEFELGQKMDKKTWSKNNDGKNFDDLSKKEKKKAFVKEFEKIVDNDEVILSLYFTMHLPYIFATSPALEEQMHQLFPSEQEAIQHLVSQTMEIERKENEQATRH